MGFINVGWAEARDRAKHPAANRTGQAQTSVLPKSRNLALAVQGPSVPHVEVHDPTSGAGLLSSHFAEGNTEAQRREVTWPHSDSRAGCSHCSLAQKAAKSAHDITRRGARITESRRAAVKPAA